jgi:DNA polymerase elongation subunit (family B)
MSAPKILTLDIESLPLELYAWGIFDVNASLEQIKTDWSILSYSAKWLDSSKIFYADTMGRGKNKVRDDKCLMSHLWELLDTADIIIAQNGKKFDIKKINARLITHGYGPYSPVRVIDTLLAVRRNFGFSSNKLAWLSEYLTTNKKSDHKNFPGFHLWLQALEDNPEARKELRKYNIQDVITTEELYIKLRPWIDNHPNMGTYKKNNTNHVCPKCSSNKVQKRGLSITQAGQYQRFQCSSCGGWSRDKTTILATENRKALLV